MRYRNLGKWGVKVSQVSLGSWLTYGGSVEDDSATACINTAYENGVNFFDTANVYRNGEAEIVVGNALSKFQRDSFVLATKLTGQMGPGPNDRGLSRKHMHEQLHHSLRRLQVDYIDLYQCHRFDFETPLEETCRTFDDFIRAGKILYWGVSEWTADQIREADELCRREGWAPPVSNQPQYNALYRRVEDDVLPVCEEIGMGNVVWSPLAMGALTGKYKPGAELPEGSRASGEDGRFMRDYLRDEVLKAVDNMQSIVDETGYTRAQLALAWCLRKEIISSVIVGASRPDQLSDTLVAGTIELSDDVISAIDELLEPVSLRPAMA